MVILLSGKWISGLSGTATACITDPVGQNIAFIVKPEEISSA
jgi:hypothetical protein